MTPKKKPTAEGSTYDNLVGANLFADAEKNLDRAIAEKRHDSEHPHKIVHWEEELHNPYGPNLRFGMWKTEPCGQPDCHHPLHSPLPL